MKISTNKHELKKLNACASGYKVFIEAHGDNEAKLSECLTSNGWDDVWWLISKTYEQLSDEQKHDLRLLACSYAKINIEKIKPYCSESDYNLIIDYLNNPTDSVADSAARSAAWSAARSAADSAAESAARSAAWSAAWSAARSAAESAADSAAESVADSAARSAARSAAWSAAMKDNASMLMNLLLKWEDK